MLYERWYFELMEHLAAVAKRGRPLGADMGLCLQPWEGARITVHWLKVLGSACQDSVLPLTSWGTLGLFVTLSEPQLFHLKMKRMVVTASKIHCEDSRGS